MVNRHCFQLQVKQELLAEYRARHAQVWPEMLEALTASGWSNYSLFVRDDGLLIGYFESEVALSDALDAMAATEANRRWQADMAPFFQDLEGTADTGLTVLGEVFHLDGGRDSVEPH